MILTAAFLAASPGELNWHIPSRRSVESMIRASRTCIDNREGTRLCEPTTTAVRNLRCRAAPVPHSGPYANALTRAAAHCSYRYAQYARGTVPTRSAQWYDDADNFYLTGSACEEDPGQEPDMICYSWVIDHYSNQD